MAVSVTMDRPLSEYGQLLDTATLLDERAGAAGGGRKVSGPWIGSPSTRPATARRRGETEDGLLSGSPEADTHKETGKYFHNNGWVVKGLRRWADLCERRTGSSDNCGGHRPHDNAGLGRRHAAPILNTWPADPADWRLPPQVEPLARPARLTGAWDVASYTNYRYWPELLSSGLLPPEPGKSRGRGTVDGRRAVLWNDTVRYVIWTTGR